MILELYQATVTYWNYSSDFTLYSRITYTSVFHILVKLKENFLIIMEIKLTW